LFDGFWECRRTITYIGLSKAYRRSTNYVTLSTVGMRVHRLMFYPFFDLNDLGQLLVQDSFISKRPVTLRCM
jgi:hypothetical protein